MIRQAREAGRNRRKIRVGLIFGGRSAEHQVSLVSASSVVRALDARKYRIIPIGITPDGRWFTAPDAIERLKEGRDLRHIPASWIVPDPTVQALVRIDERGKKRLLPLDVIFPVLHGKFGEDGAIQGLFEMANLPYVGAGVLGSSVGMDKIVTKQLCERTGIPVTPYLWFLSRQLSSGMSGIVHDVEQAFGYPCFVKPANSGSSVGISKARNRSELKAALALASEYDRKVLVEKGIVDAREIEVSVLGHDDPKASVPGEIISSNEFYDYDAKYVDGKSEAIIPARLPASLSRRVRSIAIRGFRAIDCSGMARVDFLIEKNSSRVYLSEINTIPGFTSISMYPKLWEASGLSYRMLLDRLIAVAIRRHREQQRLRVFYQPKRSWYTT